MTTVHPNFSSLLKPLTDLEVDDGAIESLIKQKSRLYREYDTIQRLAGGRGGYGEIYVAVKKLDGVKYAIKKVQIGKEDDVEKMRREVNSLACLSHPNIVRFYSSWVDTDAVPPRSDSTDGSSVTYATGGSEQSDEQDSSSQGVLLEKEGVLLVKFLCIQMELCDGNLKDWLYKRIDRGVNYDESLEIAMQVFEGIDYIHSQDWLHRDLKPLNIFLLKNTTTGEQNVKIGDFGLARKMLPGSDGVESGDLRENFTAKVGTALYAAPELEGSNYDQKSDLFSAGLILYELYYSFATEQERVVEFTKLRGKEINKNFKREQPNEDSELLFIQASIIEPLTAMNPQDRPSAADVLCLLKLMRPLNDAPADVLRSSLLQNTFVCLDLERQLREKDELIRELTSGNGGSEAG